MLICNISGIVSICKLLVTYNALIKKKRNLYKQKRRLPILFENLCFYVSQPKNPTKIYIIFVKTWNSTGTKTST